jgi:GGDEF domain-containing protein
VSKSQHRCCGTNANLYRWHGDEHVIILDALAKGSIKNKTHEEIKELIKQMFQNEYNTNNDRETKQAGMLEVDKETAYKVEIELLKRMLAEKESKVAKVNKVQEVCDFCQQDHPNGHCIPK